MTGVVWLFVFCEGPTEEAFTNLVLVPHFQSECRAFVFPLILASRLGATSRLHKGGWISYRKAGAFIHTIMQQHHGSAAWFTTLLDFYRLPQDFPGRAQPLPAAPRDKAEHLEQAMRNDLTDDTLWRFTPHLQLHGYEALILSDIDLMANESPERAEAVGRLKAELSGLAPEDVNDGPDTHPSRRIIRHVPEYAGRKVSAGPVLASRIGLARLRVMCPHFAGWITELERRLAG